MRNNPTWRFSKTNTIIKIDYPSKRFGNLEVTIDTEEDSVFIESELKVHETWVPIELMEHIVSYYNEAKKTGTVE